MGDAGLRMEEEGGGYKMGETLVEILREELRAVNPPRTKYDVSFERAFRKVTEGKTDIDVKNYRIAFGYLLEAYLDSLAATTAESHYVVKPRSVLDYAYNAILKMHATNARKDDIKSKINELAPPFFQELGQDLNNNKNENRRR